MIVPMVELFYTAVKDLNKYRLFLIVPLTWECNTEDNFWEKDKHAQRFLSKISGDKRLKDLYRFLSSTPGHDNEKVGHPAHTAVYNDK